MRHTDISSPQKKGETGQLVFQLSKQHISGITLKYTYISYILWQYVSCFIPFLRDVTTSQHHVCILLQVEDLH